MTKLENPKVYIDTTIDENIPTVAISQPQEITPKSYNLSEKPSGFQSLIKKIVNLFMDFLETGVVALSIFVVFYLFLVQPHEIKGNSMEPNFHDNEYILTDKISYRFREPKRGEIVIFKAPKNPDIDYIKRIIGLPEEKVKIQNGAVYVNGKKLDEPYINDITSLFPQQFMQEGIEITVPDGYLFVLGDNRQHSSDSREFGPIQETQIIGRAFFRYCLCLDFSSFGPIKGYDKSF